MFLCSLESFFQLFLNYDIHLVFGVCFLSSFPKSFGLVGFDLFNKGPVQYICLQNNYTFHDTGRISSCLKVSHHLRILCQNHQRRQLFISRNFSFSYLDFLQLAKELESLGSLPILQRNLTFLKQTCLGSCILIQSFSFSANQALYGRGLLCPHHQTELGQSVQHNLEECMEGTYLAL